MDAIKIKCRSQRIRLDSEADTSLPPAPFFCNVTTPIWPKHMLSSLKRWFGMCLGKRASRRASDARIRKMEESGRKPFENDRAPLIDVDEDDDEVFVLGLDEKEEMMKMVFPKYAAASFLKTGTSRAMREANNVF